MTNEVKSGSTLSEETPRRRSRRSTSEEKNKEVNKKFKIYRTRLIPIWLRLVIVLFLFLLAAIFGLMIGFGVIGDGEPMDALKWSTYQHILDIMNGKE